MTVAFHFLTLGIFTYILMLVESVLAMGLPGWGLLFFRLWRVCVFCGLFALSPCVVGK